MLLTCLWSQRSWWFLQSSNFWYPRENQNVLSVVGLHHTKFIKLSSVKLNSRTLCDLGGVYWVKSSTLENIFHVTWAVPITSVWRLQLNPKLYRIILTIVSYICIHAFYCSSIFFYWHQWSQLLYMTAQCYCVFVFPSVSVCYPPMEPWLLFAQLRNKCRSAETVSHVNNGLILIKIATSSGGGTKFDGIQKCQIPSALKL